MRSGKKFELEILEALEAAYPASTLSSVCLFQPEHFSDGHDLGFEIDHLVHFSAGEADHLVIFECKAQPVELVGAMSSQAAKEWTVTYTANGVGKRKFLKSQLFSQAQALLRNLYPRKSAYEVFVHGVVVSSDQRTPSLSQDAPTQERLKYHLISELNLRAAFQSPSGIATLLGLSPHSVRANRVQESDILRKVRHGGIVPELGHPEVPNGLRYVERCRETLDFELTKFFEPTEGKWVINGAAGMGKSVLLTYAAAVFATGRMIKEVRADRQLPKRMLTVWDSPIEKVLPPHARRKVVVCGLNPKQHEVLKRECARFRLEFETLAQDESESASGPLPGHPRVEIWSEKTAIQADVLLVDEAHDLSSNSQKQISEWWHAGKGKRYLILACDRHQKLRLLGDHATILEGVSFAGCSVRLSRNYRSPSPVYGAALALMFRWFAASGPKVMPNAGELTKAFGFSLDPTSPFPPASGGRVKLQLRNDCHPANYWSFTVARYRDFQTAYRWIEEWGLSQQQVLWVRFSHTDPYADHSSADRVQLRDLRVLEPDHVIDTHIKGREFPVVVIEGLPADLNSSDESSMLLWRRRLYLCASRATCFLFFVSPDPSAGGVAAEWDVELSALLKSCSTPSNRQESSSKFWTLEFDYPERALKPDAFREIESPTAEQRPSATELTPVLVEEVTVIADAKPITPPLAAVEISPPPAAVAPPQEAPPPQSTQVATKQVAPVAKQEPERLSRKDFQRTYGNEKGWGALYDRYLQTGVLPPAPPKQAFHAIPKPQVERREAQVKQLKREVVMTPRMISEHLGVKAFHILKTGLEIMKERRIPSMPQMDIALPEEVTARVYQRHNASLPDEADLQKLKRLVAATSAKR